jgi:hypothetical protein
VSPLARLVSLSFALGIALVVEVACTAGKPDACMVDTDCPKGSFCREGLCAAVASDGGTGTDAASGVCGTLDNPCADQDSGAGSSSGSPSCKDVYALCSGDFECCAGLACTSGACR